MFDHFIAAQASTYEQALSELAAGRKRSHWMWFIFPQIAGLGHSPMAQRYALPDLAAAKAYIDHPVLGPRLEEAVQTTLPHARNATAHAIFGSPDDLKFRSSLTLFARGAPEQPLFAQALKDFYGGAEDPETLRRI